MLLAERTCPAMEENGDYPVKCHFHQCPYCSIVYTCDEGCFSTRVNNKICNSCKAVWQSRLLTVVREYGTLWQDDILW